MRYLGARVIHRTDRMYSFSSPLWRPSHDQSGQLSSQSTKTPLSASRQRMLSLAMVRISLNQPSVPTYILPRRIRCQTQSSQRNLIRRQFL
jgi:hypothetical protein